MAVVAILEGGGEKGLKMKRNNSKGRGITSKRWVHSGLRNGPSKIFQKYATPSVRK